MLQKALQQAAIWKDKGLNIPVAVNLSALDLQEPDLISHISHALSEANCSPSQLEIELTESTVIHDPAITEKQLNSLKQLGISLSLDDFGTGYSSLSHLHHFPFDTLKIDRSFVADLPYNRDAIAIIRATINLAHELGMQTVAEGVENRMQLDLLVNLGIDTIQGYVFSRPLAPELFLHQITSKYAW